MTKLRQPLERFANACERRLQANDGKGRYGWKGWRKKVLAKHLAVELVELAIEISKQNKEGIKREACDVANFAMMIFDDRSN